VTHAELVLVGRVLLSFGLCFAIGFERELRGSPAGDRTYAMIGLAAAAVTSVTERISPQAIAGVLTGIGFVGGGLVFREGVKNIKGITSAATIVAVAGIGIVCGTGHPLLAIGVAALVMIDLELRNIPGLRRLDARRYVGQARDDMAPPMSRGSATSPPESPSVEK
jgi:putative Mg2+ transporter-C (MgtC) family protein